MRIKFFSFIVSLVFISIAISSCLDSDNVTEYSSDTTIHAFGLDTIHGKHYRFIIDNLQGQIYNPDSLPVGADTIIDRILIDTLTVAGWVTSGSPDTLFNTSDSVDLRNPIKLKVHAPDGLSSREYTVTVLVHKQDPDSLVWNEMTPFSTTRISDKQQVVTLGNELLVYTATQLFRAQLPLASSWSEQACGLPANALLSSIVNWDNTLYVPTTDGDVYSSQNGTTWQKSEGLSKQADGSSILTLIASLPANDIQQSPSFLCAIMEKANDEGVMSRYFCRTFDGLGWELGTEVPADFPVQNIHATMQPTANDLYRLVISGTPDTPTEHTVPWFTFDGVEWADLGTTSDAYCPGMTNPAIIYYGDLYYMLGGDFSDIYYSITGIAWYKTEEKFLYPVSFKDKQPYSMVIDKNNFIWLIWGGEGSNNEVWRGRLNKLGFDKQ